MTKIITHTHTHTLEVTGADLTVDELMSFLLEVDRPHGIVVVTKYDGDQREPSQIKITVITNG